MCLGLVPTWCEVSAHPGRIRTGSLCLVSIAILIQPWNLLWAGLLPTFLVLLANKFHLEAGSGNRRQGLGELMPLERCRELQPIIRLFLVTLNVRVPGASVVDL